MRLAARPAEAAGWTGRLISLGSGVLIGLGQAPFGLWPLAFSGLVLALMRVAGAASASDGFWRGFIIGVGFALVALNWIIEPFFVDAARHGWMAPFALAAMAAGFGIVWGAGLWLAIHLAPGRGGRRLTALVLGWTAAEVLRSYVLTGFPWALISAMWVGTPFYQAAAFVGPHGVTLVTLAIAAGVAAWLNRAAPFRASLALAGLAPLWLLGALTTPLAGLDKHTTRPVVRLIQPNAPQHQKWDPDWRPVFFERQLSLTAEPGAYDFVVWPEVAVTFALNDPSAPYQRIADAAGGRPVVLGGQRVEGRAAFNSLIVLGGDGLPQALYDKHHLVPFGEYVPGGAVARRFGLRGLAEQLEFGFTAGPGPVTLSLPDGLTFLPLICYEAIFAHEIRRAATRPDFLMHLTNDAWFGQMIGPYQHLDQARARAVEFGLPVVRVANTGISAVIYPDGWIRASLPLRTSGKLDVRLPAATPATLYWRYGDIPVLALMIVLGLALAVLRRRVPD